MVISAHVETFAGLPVRDYDPGTPLQGPAETIYRLSCTGMGRGEEPAMTEILATFLDDPAAGQAPGLVIGAWDYDDMVSTGPGAVIEALVAARDRLPNLKALFLGDIVYEECEISWINQGDVSPLLAAYPDLEHFRVRGGTGLTLGTPRHGRLRFLTIEAGGLPANVVREAAVAELPQLEHLELWLGTPEYGGDATPEDLRPILDGLVFPRLRYLGLRNSAAADAIARAVATAPVLERIRILDLSLGNLSDEGAEPLLTSPAVARLEKLDLHHHYLSAAVQDRFRRLGPDVDLGEQREPDVYGEEEHRYNAVSE